MKSNADGWIVFWLAVVMLFGGISLAGPPHSGQKLVLTERGVAKAVIIIPERSEDAKENQAVERSARIIREHLETMSGARISVVTPSQVGNLSFTQTGISSDKPEWQGSNFIAVGWHHSLDQLGISLQDLGPEGILLQTVGNTVVITGSDNLGLRHATYAFLETLGCRYLWPGELGKVIPKNATVVVNSLKIKEAPRLASRSIRFASQGNPTMVAGMRRVGIDPPTFQRLFKAACLTEQTDDGWSAWQRLGAHQKFHFGHSFGHFWKEYGEAHPEWFALQPNGSRSQFLAPGRPRLCQSNSALIDQIIAEKLEELRNDPSKEGVAIGLNDGGRTTFCMCEDCRKKDPKEGKRIQLMDDTTGTRYFFPYVSLSDRVLWFSNQIAEGVAKVFPGKHLGFDAYSVYNAPPLKITPHPNLVIRYVGNSREDWEGWSKYGNAMYYRPNTLMQNWRICVPQNYSRKLFDFHKYIYAHGASAAEYCESHHDWALKGIIYYVMAKALWNPEAVDVDALIADYCRSGFGKAGPLIEKYFATLEKLSIECEARKSDMDKELEQRDMDEDDPERKNATALALASVDIRVFFDDGVIEELQALLERAKVVAAGESDEKVLKRVEFIKMGFDFGAMRARNYRRLLALNGEPGRVPVEEREQAEAEEVALLGAIVAQNPLAINPGLFGSAWGYSWLQRIKRP